MTLTDEQKMNIRLNLALNKIEGAKTLDELEGLYQWVIGPQSSILSVARVMEMKR